MTYVCYLFSAILIASVVIIGAVLGIAWAIAKVMELAERKE